MQQLTLVEQMNTVDMACAIRQRQVAADPSGLGWRYRVTAGQWEQRPVELRQAAVFLYLTNYEEMDLDPWVQVQGMSSQDGLQTFDVKLTDGTSHVVAAADLLLYVDEDDAVELARHAPVHPASTAADRTARAEPARQRA